MNTDFISPTIVGDPRVALIAQLNRFRKHAKSPELPLTTPIDATIAREAILLLGARFTSSLISVPDPTVLQLKAETDKALKDPIRYVTSNIDQIAKTLAIYGDTLGYPVAPVGITTRSTKRKLSTLQWGLIILGVGAVGAGIIYAIHRQQTSEPLFDLPSSVEDALNPST